jgi:hypothetical protein
MTGDWQIRRCNQCGALESDPTIALAFDWYNGEVVHLTGGGVLRCGALAAVDDAEVSR